MILQMHCNNLHFSIDQVCTFDLAFLVKGWQVTTTDGFTTALILCVDKKTYKKTFVYCFNNRRECTKFSGTKILHDE